MYINPKALHINLCRELKEIIFNRFKYFLERKTIEGFNFYQYKDKENPIFKI